MTPPTTNRRRVILFVACAIGIMAVPAGVNGAASGTGGGEPRSVRSVPVEGGTGAQRGAAVAAVAALDSPPSESRIRAVRIGAPPDAEFIESAGGGDSSWIYIDVEATDDADSVKSIWQAMLVVSALYAEENSPLIAGRTVTVHLPDGDTRDGGSALVRPPTRADITVNDANALREVIDSGARRSRLRVESIDITQPRALAVAIHATAVSEAEFAEQWQGKLYEIVGHLRKANHPLVEGVFVEIRSPSGEVLARSATAPRLSQGVGWVSPTLLTNNGS